MAEEAKFSREQLSRSKTFGYDRDLVLAVLEEGSYTKAEAEAAIRRYLTGKRRGH